MFAYNAQTPLVATRREAAPAGTGGPARSTTPFAPSQPQQVSITFLGDIIVQVSGEGKNPRQIAEETVAELRRMALSHTGDTLVFGSW